MVFLIFFALFILGMIIFSISTSSAEKKAQVERLRQENYKLLDKNKDQENRLKEADIKIAQLKEIDDLLTKEIEQHEENLRNLLRDKTESMPWLAGMMADYLTYDLEVEAKKLDWGYNVQRENKVASIRLIRAEAQRRIEEAKEAVYQLEYLRKLFPEIDDVLLADYQDLHLEGTIPEHDPVLDYLSREEWQSLSEDEKNQLALDRYIASKKKSNWQIGRDYELAVAYEYSQKGYKVETFGSYMGLEDLGRDLIARKGTEILIIQCKYWAQSKKIHEKHIYQLYGTAVGYCIENDVNAKRVKPVFVTNITLSDMAKQVANYLEISVIERHEMVEFPRIKCKKLYQ